ncbi:hypothetical protein TKK_0005850 [Trichogramma kaykai]
MSKTIVCSCEPQSATKTPSASGIKSTNFILTMSTFESTDHAEPAQSTANNDLMMEIERSKQEKIMRNLNGDNFFKFKDMLALINWDCKESRYQFLREFNSLIF